jgi:tRNA-dihydrouridine synthase A
MMTTGALLHGDAEHFLRFSETEHPLALQLGGSEPTELARCARMGEQAGYDEINLNVGCPSDRVQSGRFGACLMAEPELVADCVSAMRDTVALPVTVKTRIGIDDQNSYQALFDFVSVLQKAGVDSVIVHARKAWLQGLSPKQNREIPPLNYARVYQLKNDFPDLHIAINGGVTEVEQICDHLKQVDSVMIGRAAYKNPYLLGAVERSCFDAEVVPTRHEVIERFLPYVEQQLNEGARLHQLTRHILGLFNGVPGAKSWRRVLSEQANRPGAGPELIERALACVPSSPAGKFVNL